MKIRQSNEQTEHGITNKPAWLTKANRPLGVRDAPMPTPNISELVVQNVAIAMNGALISDIFMKWYRPCMLEM
jgi:hypothetical protein